MHTNGSCGIARTMEILGGKWTILLVRDLMEGPRRFSELEHSLAGISPRTLAARLKELEEDSIISRDCSPGHPVYSLTERGLGLHGILDQMRWWGTDMKNAPQGVSAS